MDARLVTKVISTGRVVQTRTVRNMSKASIQERACDTTLAVARAFDQPPDSLTTEIVPVSPDRKAPIDPFAGV